MICIQDILDCIEEHAPLPLQENYDNAGLITGDASAVCHGVLLSLDCTEKVVEEAITTGCNLIVAHHPILFRPLRKLSANDYVSRPLVKAIKNDIAIYAAHTNADNVAHGVNLLIARKLGLKNLRVLSPKKGLLKKLVVFVPESHRDAVASAVFHAGAGVIGNYDSCSFNAPGFGTFRGGDNTHPFLGEKNVVNKESEIRFETIYPAHLENKILQALRSSHPYEEPAFDLVPLDNSWPQVGAGIVGETERKLSPDEWFTLVLKIFSIPCLTYTPAPDMPFIQKVAICGGSGSFLVREAIASGCQCFLTADVKYHEFFDADGKIILTNIGHYESEKFTPELFKIWIEKKFTKFAVRFSQTNTNPVKYFLYEHQNQRKD